MSHRDISYGVVTHVETVCLLSFKDKKVIKSNFFLGE